MSMIRADMGRLVRAGKAGRVTHVSVFDRRSLPPGKIFTDPGEYAQLIEAGVDDFGALSAMLGVRPVSVICRAGNPPSSPYRHGSLTEAFIEMEHNLHVHYFGSLGSAVQDHETWVQGEKGVLWTDQRLVWWRKRGWPRFLPIGIFRLSGSRTTKLQRERALALVRQLTNSMKAGSGAETGGQGHSWSSAVLQAAIESDRTGGTVRVPVPPGGLIETEMRNQTGVRV